MADPTDCYNACRLHFDKAIVAGFSKLYCIMLYRYKCDCTDTGFMGVFCDVNINDCLSSPCMNGANCTDGVKVRWKEPGEGVSIQT